jgi:hypothetical protein
LGIDGSIRTLFERGAVGTRGKVEAERQGAQKELKGSMEAARVWGEVRGRLLFFRDGRRKRWKSTPAAALG